MPQLAVSAFGALLAGGLCASTVVAFMSVVVAGSEERRAAAVICGVIASLAWVAHLRYTTSPVESTAWMQRSLLVGVLTCIACHVAVPVCMLFFTYYRPVTVADVSEHPVNFAIGLGLLSLTSFFFLWVPSLTVALVAGSLCATVHRRMITMVNRRLTRQ
jgi:hypothetical protein